MSGEKVKGVIQSVAEVAGTHPKVITAVVAATTSFNVWFATYEPIFRFVTTVLGILILLALLTKNCLDIIKGWFEIRKIMKRPDGKTQINNQDT